MTRSSVCTKTYRRRQMCRSAIFAYNAVGEFEKEKHTWNIDDWVQRVCAFRRCR